MLHYHIPSLPMNISASLSSEDILILCKPLLSLDNSGFRTVKHDFLLKCDLCSMCRHGNVASCLDVEPRLPPVSPPRWDIITDFRRMYPKFELMDVRFTSRVSPKHSSQVEVLVGSASSLGRKMLKLRLEESFLFRGSPVVWMTLFE